MTTSVTVSYGFNLHFYCLVICDISHRPSPMYFLFLNCLCLTFYWVVGFLPIDLLQLSVHFEPLVCDRRSNNLPFCICLFNLQIKILNICIQSVLFFGFMVFGFCVTLQTCLFHLFLKIFQFSFQLFHLLSLSLSVSFITNSLKLHFDKRCEIGIHLYIFFRSTCPKAIY